MPEPDAARLPPARAAPAVCGDGAYASRLQTAGSPVYNERRSHLEPAPVVYVCNCNGIREREVRAAIEAGATKPAHVFRYRQCAPQCAKCVCDMRCLIQSQQRVMRLAAE